MTEPRILDHGQGWIAIDKPTGMSVHNAEPSQGADGPFELDTLGWLVNFLRSEGRDIARATGWNESHKPSPCHRLDRDTSGILVLALDKRVASELQQAFEKQNTHKSYRAIVRGKLERDGEWTYALTDRAEGRQRPEGAKNAQKPCRTAYRVARSNPYITELEIDLFSGRQHQIRRHAALSKHQVVGDRRYGDARYNKKIETLFGVSRLMLHAERLKLTTSRTELDLYAAPPHEFELLFANKSEASS